MIFNSHYRNRLVNQLKYIINEDPGHLKEIEKEDKYFMTLMVPKNLDGNDSENIIYRSRKEFEKLCIIMLTQGMPSPDKMSLFRFFTMVKHFEEKNKPKQPK